MKGEGFQGWMGRVISREAAGRRLRAIEAIVVVVVLLGFGIPIFWKLFWSCPAQEI